MDENEVVKAICSYLERKGYSIRQRLNTTERGVDIIAEQVERQCTIYVEAKGGTSSRAGSPKYGIPYDQRKVFDVVAKGVFTALCLRGQHPNRDIAEVALATPDGRWFRHYLVQVAEQLSASGVTTLLVAGDGTVSQL